MTVYKINKKQFFWSIVLLVVNVGVVISMPFIKPHIPQLFYFLWGLWIGFNIPLIIGITKINKEKMPFEKIEIGEEYDEK